MALTVELPADDRTLEAVLRDHRFGPPDFDEVTPWDFVGRWPEAAVRDRAWPIISRLLIDDDELVRALAVDFARTWSAGTALAVPRLLEVAERHPDRFGDQQVNGISLRYRLAHALSDKIDASNFSRVATLLREMATHEPVAGSVLGRFDPAFVTAHAQQWGDAQARWIEEAARSLALFRRDDVISFLHALRGMQQSNRTRILTAVEEFIKRDDQDAIALANSWGLPHPTRPAPSPADCKSAIGL